MWSVGRSCAARQAQQAYQALQALQAQVPPLQFAGPPGVLASGEFLLVIQEPCRSDHRPTAHPLLTLNTPDFIPTDETQIQKKPDFRAYYVASWRLYLARLIKFHEGRKTEKKKKKKGKTILKMELKIRVSELWSKCLIYNVEIYGHQEISPLEGAIRLGHDSYSEIGKCCF